jgi:SdrD B-like domain
MTPRPAISFEQIQYAGANWLRPVRLHLASGQNVSGQDFDNFHWFKNHAVRDVSFTITHGTTTTTVTDLHGNTHAGDTVVAHFTVRGAGPTVVSLVTYDASTASQLALAGDATGTFGPGPHSLTIQVPTSDYQIDFVAGAAIDHFGPAGSNISYSAEKRLISADSGAGSVAQANASLSGIVYFDANGNSSFDAGETGIGGALVTLTGTDYLGQSVNAAFTTDSTGLFSFTGLLPGTYTIYVNAPFGFLPEMANAGSLGGTPAVTTTLNIVVLNGAAGTGYNFAEIPGMPNS